MVGDTVLVLTKWRRAVAFDKMIRDMMVRDGSGFDVTICVVLGGGCRCGRGFEHVQ